VQIPLPDRAERGPPHLFGLCGHSEAATHMGSPILPGIQNKTQEGTSSLPRCHSNESSRKVASLAAAVAVSLLGRPKETNFPAVHH
jgi:hypothetical protein